MKIYLKALMNFLVPEENVSVKVLFDNIRNSIIAATFVSGAAWLKTNAQLLGPNADWAWKLFAIVAFGLAALSAMQAMAIARRVNTSLGFGGARSAAPLFIRAIAAVGIAFILAVAQLASSMAFFLAIVRGTGAAGAS